MAKRKGKDSRQTGASGPAPAARSTRGAWRVLAVEPDPGLRIEMQSALASLGVVCDTAGTLADSRAALGGVAYDLVVVDEQLRDGCGLELARELSAGSGLAGASGAAGTVRVIVTSARSALQGAVEAMRSGAIDYIVKPTTPTEFAQRVRTALEQVSRARDERRRVQRLERLCKRLSSERREVTKQVDTLCQDLVNAYQELADQMGHVSLASEYSSLVRQELDVENLLRTTLEYLLTKTGPTNAAIFLPTGHSDFNLGAYVNYDLPKDTADVLLDHLADVMAPKFQQDAEVTRFESAEALEVRLGEGASWLNDCGVVTFACREGGDCLAVVALFRDRKHPFADELMPVLATIRDIFGEQLARVVRIHHRHNPKDAWPGFDIEDDRGLAA